MRNLAFPCHVCGEVHICTQDITAYLTNDERLAWISVACPICARTMVVMTSPHRVRTVLIQDGVTVVLLGAPAREIVEGPPIGWDDLIDLHFELETFVGFVRPDPDTVFTAPAGGVYEFRGHWWVGEE